MAAQALFSPFKSSFFNSFLLMESYWLLAASWAAYFFVHSAMATSRVKRWFDLSPKRYRQFYVAISLLGLLPIVWQVIRTEPYWLFPNGAVNRFLGLALATFGVIYMRVSFRNYDLRAFLGLSEELDQGLIRKGMLQHVRHPIYFATLLLAIGYVLYAPAATGLLSAASIVIYIFVGIYFEEKKLVAAFGDKYRVYQQQVPMIIPKNWVKALGR